MLALFWVVYSRYLLPMADRLEQVWLPTSAFVPILLSPA